MLVSLNRALSTYDPIKNTNGSNVEALGKADRQLGKGLQKGTAFIREF